LICKQCCEILDFYWPAFDASRLPGAAAAWGRIDRKCVVVNGPGAKPREIQARRVLNCSKADPAYGEGVAKALGLSSAALSKGGAV
jgi:hypothetical protein